MSVPYGLELQPETVELWDGDDIPTSTEWADTIKPLGDNDVELDESRPEKPIVALRIFNSQLSDETGRRIVGQTPHLESLNCRRVLFGDGFLPAVGQLDSLRFLSLQNSRVTDAGLQHLASLTALQELHLSETAVSDTGILLLKDLPSLRKLDLQDTFVTHGGVEKLRQALPDCTIWF